MQLKDRVKILLSCFLIFFIFFCFYCSGQTSSSVIKNPYISSEREALSLSSPQTVRDRSPQTMEPSSGGNFASTECYLNIKRNIMPNYKDYYLKNKINNIQTEIQGCSRSFNNILIRDSIDDELIGFSGFHIYIENPFESTQRIINEAETANFKNNFIKNIYDPMGENYIILNNTIYIKVPVLKSGENIKYGYGIQSNKSGIFNINTRLRLSDSKWPDLEKVDTIEIRPPEVAVGIEADRSYATKGIDLNITYNILHKSGWCKDPIYFNIRFDRSTEYEISYANGTKYNYENINLTFYPLEVTKYLIKIRYNASGLHPIPILNVEGATVSHEKINIEVFSNNRTKYLQDNAVLISAVTVLISIFAILITIIDMKEAREDMGAIIRHVTNKPPSIYGNLRKIILLELYIFMFISLLWTLINIVFINPYSFLLYISIPLLFFIFLLFQYIFINKK